MRISALMILLLLLSLVIRFFLFNVFSNEGAIESLEYDDIAKNIVEGRGFVFNNLGAVYRSFQPPLHAIAIAGLYELFGITPTSVICLQIILSLMTGLIVFYIARRITGKGTALIAATLVLFHPGLILYSVKKIHALSFDAFLFSAVILVTMRLRESPSWRKAAFLGFLFGITLLARPSINVFLPVIIIWLFILLRKDFLKKVSYIVLFTALTAATISPWVIRNYLIHKRFILGATVDSEVFWRGNNPSATGATFREDKTIVLMADNELYEKIIPMSEVERRDFFMKEAMRFIKNNPDKFLRLYFKKIYYFWWFSPVAGLLYPTYYFYIYKIFYIFILFFALIGLTRLLMCKNRAIIDNTLLLLFFLISISLFQALYYVEVRHRWGIEPILMIFSSIGIMALINRKILCKTE